MAQNIQYKCLKCGGALGFDSASQKMVCPYCDSIFDISEFESKDEEIAESAGQAPDSGSYGDDNGSQDIYQEGEQGSVEGSWNTDAGGSWESGEQESMRVYKCPSCSGEIIGDENTAATTCPYCGNQTVMAGQLSGTLRPDLIIPFKRKKEDAVRAFEKNLEGKRLLPKIFKDRHHIDEIKGIYVPFWLFDADAQVNIDYDARNMRVWQDRDNDYTETSYYRVNRHGSISFENLPADGSKKMPDDLMESIEPFDYGDAVDFSAAYLAGYLADKYDVTAEDSLDRIDRRARNTAESAFGSSVTGYDLVRAERVDIRLISSRAKYALLPVYLLNTQWGGETYTFAMNGQTGKFVGDLPVDKAQSRKWFLGIAAAVTVVVFVLSNFLF